jgi:hypothetical protein
VCLRSAKCLPVSHNTILVASSQVANSLALSKNVSNLYAPVSHSQFANRRSYVVSINQIFVVICQSLTSRCQSSLSYHHVTANQTGFASLLALLSLPVHVSLLVLTSLHILARLSVAVSQLVHASLLVLANLPAHASLPENARLHVSASQSVSASLSASVNLVTLASLIIPANLTTLVSPPANPSLHAHPNSPATASELTDAISLTN